MLWGDRMDEPKQSNDLILGQILGKVDGMNNAINTMSTTFASHVLSDKESFESLRRQMETERKEREDQREKDKKEQNEARNFIAKITGALILLSAVASYLVPYILSKL